MSYSSINISNTEHNFKYVIEYNDTDQYSVNDYTYCKDNNNIYICNNDIKDKWIQVDNIWISSNSDYEPLQSYIRLSNITLYFPVYSIESYSKYTDYAFSLNININNKTIYLGTYIVNRINALAADKIMKFHNENYYECIKFKIPNPYDIIYSDEWKDWRINVCECSLDDGVEINNESSVLNITLNPVFKTGDIYVKHDVYNGGQNCIKFDNYRNNLHHNLSIDLDNSPCMSFVNRINFNNVYEQNINGLFEYLKETYDIQDCILRYDYYIQDNENIYAYYSKYVNDIKCELTKYDIQNSEYPIDSWNGFVEGIFINSSLNIIDRELIDKEEGILLTLMSNNIPLTQDVYRYLIKSKNDNEIDFIKLNLIDMKVYDINVVNKIEQNIIQVERPKDYKSNLIKPVYYRTRELGNIIFHPSVTENICINLDAYKSQASLFRLQLEGVIFNEKARVSNGVIFKVVGNSLPGSTPTGIYYILNQDNELITTGKYTYES